MCLRVKRIKEMSNVKQGLKAAKAALDSQNFDEAASQARTVLEADPKNYFAYVPFITIWLGR